MTVLSDIVPDLEPAIVITSRIVQATDAVAADLNALLMEIDAFRVSVRERQQKVKSASQRLRLLSAQQLDERIGGLLAAEQQLSLLRAESRDRASRAEEMSRGVGSDRTVLLQRIADAADEMFVDILCVMRDARWDAMAARADREPQSSETVIETPADLRAFFENIEPG